MNNFLTDDTKAILLLCSFIGKDRTRRPLTQSEYSSLAKWLLEADMRPKDILHNKNLAEAATGTGMERQRLEYLASRSVELGFALEEWQRYGIWIVSRSDSDYPARYKSHLRYNSPPILFGVGNRSILKGGGLGIVGSRNIDDEGAAFARHAAQLCAFNDMPVVSGGARGVDQIAMAAAVESGGVAIGIMAENLLKKSLERSTRLAIADGKLLLLSPYNPEARFTVGTAMARNKLIYAMADFTLIVSAEHRKGGTWAGANEELRRDTSRPVFVRFGNNTPFGNSKLLELGATAWPEVAERNNLKKQLSDLSRHLRNSENLELFDSQTV